MAEQLHEPLHEAYDVDVAKLNRLAARSAERAEALKAENAELRELVRDMRKAFIHNACYRWCEYMPEPCNGACQYLRRIKKLGIEV